MATRTLRRSAPSRCRSRKPRFSSLSIIESLQPESGRRRPQAARRFSAPSHQCLQATVFGGDEAELVAHGLVKRLDGILPLAHKLQEVLVHVGRCLAGEFNSVI